MIDDKIDAKIITVPTINKLPLINHVGLMVEEDGQSVVYHKDNNKVKNKCGGNLYRQDIDTFKRGRAILKTESVKVSPQVLAEVYESKCAEKYNIAGGNCENFVNLVVYGKSASPQLQKGLLTVAGVALMGWVFFNTD